MFQTLTNIYCNRQKLNILYSIAYAGGVYSLQKNIELKPAHELILPKKRVYL